MNNIINKFLLAGDKFIPEMHLRQPKFIFSNCRPFKKKQSKNTKIHGNRRLQVVYLQERSTQGLFLA